MSSSSTKSEDELNITSMGKAFDPKVTLKYMFRKEHLINL